MKSCCRSCTRRWPPSWPQPGRRCRRRERRPALAAVHGGFMSTESTADLIDLVQRLGQPRVLVVGDLMLDRYVWGDAERISQEAPVILLHADQREERLGGGRRGGAPPPPPRRPGRPGGGGGPRAPRGPP